MRKEVIVLILPRIMVYDNDSKVVSRFKEYCDRHYISSPSLIRGMMENYLQRQEAKKVKSETGQS
jgi:hypothetical protein